MKKKKFFLSGVNIRKRLILCFLIPILTSAIFLTVFLYARSNSVITGQSVDYMCDILDSISERVDLSMDALNQAAKIAISSPSLQELAGMTEDIPTADWFAWFMELQELFTTLTVSQNYIDSILLYDNNGEQIRGLFSVGYSIPAEALLNDDFYIREPARFRYVPSQNQRVIPLVKRIKSTQTFQAIGYIQFNLDKQALTEIFESRMNRIDGNLFVTDADGNVIAGVQSLRNPVDLSRAGDLPESENYRIQQIDGREYMVVSYLSDVTGWRTSALIPMSELNGELLRMLAVSVIIGLSVCLALAVFFAVKTSFGISSPIIGITEAMKRAEKGDYSVRVDYESTDEIGYLAKSFNRTLAETDRLVNEVYKLQLIEREYEVKTLQAQMNPHFLYNTLDTINFLAVQNKAPAISRMVIALSDLMRSSVSKKGPLITIEEDLALAEDYLGIIQARFGDRLKVYYDIDDRLMEHQIPKLTLQPIIENAVKHGLEGKPNDWVIEITGILRDNLIELSVGDNGLGMSSKRLEMVLSRSCPEDDTHTRLGVEYVEKRMKLLFGQRAELLIESRENEGTRVTIRLPMEPLKEEPNHVPHSDR